MSYISVLKNINQISGMTGNALNAVTNILGSSDTSPQSIKDKILGGFLGNTTQFKPSVFSRLFDEPTYLTFRVEFNFANDLPENTFDSTYNSFNAMPEPLFDLGSSYSTVSYLKNALGDANRARTLEAFINGLKDIQTNYSYYFQSIEGLDTLMKVNPENGMRIIPDENIITINCLEGLDMKINGLMQMYRKVAWDDYYQRWILPDMMRYFNLKIYVSEIRLFHSMSESLAHYSKSPIFDMSKGETLNATSLNALKTADIFGITSNVLNAASAVTSRFTGTNSTAAEAKKIIDYGTETVTTAGNMLTDANMVMRRMCNNAINDVMPTICIDCKMCEFDISDSLSILNSLTASRPEEPTSGIIKIKVGQVFDSQFYPLNNALKIKDSAVGEKYIVATSENPINPYYLDDKVFAKDEQLNANDSAYTTNRITKTINRMNPAIDAEGNKVNDLSYRINRASVDNTFQQITTELLYTLVKLPSEPSKAIYNGDKINPKEYEYIKNSNKESATEQDIMDLLSKEEREEYANRVSTAVQVLEETANEIENSKEIESTALSEEEKIALKEIVLTNVLEGISKSKATEENKTLIDLSNIILDKSKRLSATSNRTVNNFEYINK